MTQLHTDITHHGWRIAVRLQLARLLNRLPGTCWAELVGWAMLDGPLRNVWQSAACSEDIARTGGNCYCGKHRRGKEKTP